jgi:hypothetical protein
MSFLLDLHPAISFFIVVIISIALSMLGLKIVRSRISQEQMKENHEVAGFIFNAFGLLYAVLVAFVVFATWTNYDETSKNVEMEANKLSDMFLDANAFPDTMKREIRVAIRDYTKSVVDQEWGLMERHERISPAIIQNLRNIWNAYLKIDVKALNNPNMYDESLRQLNQMSEYRRLRWFSSRESTPLVIWLVLIVGGVTCVVFTFFFGTKQIKAQYLMTGVLALTNSMVLFLIYVLDHPFVGYNAISNEPFQTVLHMFQHMLGG